MPEFTGDSNLPNPTDAVALAEWVRRHGLDPVAVRLDDERLARLAVSSRDPALVSERFEVAEDARSTKGRPLSRSGLARAAECKSAASLYPEQIKTLSPEKFAKLAKALRVSVEWLREGKLLDEDGNEVYASSPWRFAVPQDEPNWEQIEPNAAKRDLRHREWVDRSRATFEDLVRDGTVPDFLLPYIQARCAHDWITRFATRTGQRLHRTDSVDGWMRGACRALTWWSEHTEGRDHAAYGRMFAWLPVLPLIHRLQATIPEISDEYRHHMELTHEEVGWLYDAVGNYWISRIDQFVKEYETGRTGAGTGHLWKEFEANPGAATLIGQLYRKLGDLVNLKNIPPAGGKITKPNSGRKPGK